MVLYTYGVYKPGQASDFTLRMYAEPLSDKVVVSDFQLGTSSVLPFPFVRHSPGAEGVVCSAWDFGKDWEKPLSLVALGLCATKGLYTLTRLPRDACIFTIGDALTERLNGLCRQGEASGQEYFRWWDASQVWEWVGTCVPVALQGGSDA